MSDVPHAGGGPAPTPSLESFRLENAVAVVTGATSDIGAAIVRAFARAGCGLVLLGRDGARLDKLSSSIVQAGGTVLGQARLDVRDPTAIDEVLGSLLERIPPPTVLVNCAGGSVIKPAFELSVAEWDELHEIHLRGSFLVSRTCAAAMATAEYGKIINLSSTWAFTVGQGQAAYASAKAGVSHLTSALALEWAPLGVRVNALAPAATRTARVQAHLDAHPDREDYLIERIPLGRIATPDDIVGPALFLASPWSDFVTGHTLLVDGGWVASK